MFWKWCNIIIFFVVFRVLYKCVCIPYLRELVVVDSVCELLSYLLVIMWRSCFCSLIIYSYHAQCSWVIQNNPSVFAVIYLSYVLSLSLVLLHVWILSVRLLRLSGSFAFMITSLIILFHGLHCVEQKWPFFLWKNSLLRYCHKLLLVTNFLFFCLIVALFCHQLSHVTF